MTITQIIALIRDTAIVAALGWIVWRIYTDGENAVKVADITAVQKQLTANAQQQSQWAQEASNAAIQRTQDMAAVTAAIGAQRAPVFLQPASAVACAGTVSGHPAAPPSPAAPSGGSGEGRGVDLRPAIDRFELKYEQALADCRAVLNQWPKVTP